MFSFMRAGTRNPSASLSSPFPTRTKQTPQSVMVPRRGLCLFFALALGCNLAVMRAPAHAGAATRGEPWHLGAEGQEKAGAGHTIFRTAELAKSDPRLAGLILRCSKDSIEPVIVVVEPFPPGAQPKIILRVAGHESYFTGSILPAGVGIRLPIDGTKMVEGHWLSAKDVEVTITEGDVVIRGAVGLSGLPEEIAALRVECVQK
jgi:hypothetical protein